jgi:hypothetical protein
MKFFWLFFSILLLTLSVLPCGDTIECNDNTRTEIAQQDNHEKHNHNSELCSPFCSCACCGIAVSQFIPVKFEFKKLVFVEIVKHQTFYKFNFSSINICHIWQPPKIS